MKRLLYLAVIGIMAGPVCAQEKDPIKERLDSSSRHHEWVTVKTEKGREVKCYIVFPEVDKKATAVIVIHENKGLTDWERSVADQLAEAGYIAIAPDFLSGTGPNGGATDSFGSSDEARKGIYKLPPEQVMSDVNAVIDYAEKVKAANGKVVVGGFCWGGGKAFATAVNNPNIKAAFVFYGSAPEEADLKKIKVPVYGFYGGNDFRITGQVPKVAEAMKAAGKTFEPVTYEGAGHGFMRSGEGPNASEANRKAREAAWQRWRDLLGKI